MTTFFYFYFSLHSNKNKKCKTNLNIIKQYYIMDIKTIYNVDVVVNYKNYEDNGEDEVCSDTIYRKQLLETLLLNIEEFDKLCDQIENIRLYIDKILAEKLTPQQKEIYNSILLKCAGHFISDDTSMGFMILFSYDYFYLIHDFIRDIIIKNSINDELLNELKNKICK